MRNIDTIENLFHFLKHYTDTAYIVQISQSKIKKLFNFYNHLIANVYYIFILLLLRKKIHLGWSCLQGQPDLAVVGYSIKLIYAG